MKTKVSFVLVVVIGALSLTAAACGNDAKATDKEQPAAATGHGDHAGHADHADHGGDADHKMKDGAKEKNGFEGMPAAGTKALCPVMKNEFTVKVDSPKSIYQGKTYVFCCPACKPKFDADPKKYL